MKAYVPFYRLVVGRRKAVPKETKRTENHGVFSYFLITHIRSLAHIGIASRAFADGMGPKLTPNWA